MITAKFVFALIRRNNQFEATEAFYSVFFGGSLTHYQGQKVICAISSSSINFIKICPIVPDAKSDSRFQCKHNHAHYSPSCSMIHANLKLV